MNKKSYISLSVAICLALGAMQAPAACAADTPKENAAAKTQVAADKNKTTAASGNTEQQSVEFPQKPPKKWDKNTLKKLQLAEASPFTIPMLIPSETENQTTILGEAVATQEQMVSMIKRRNPKPLLNCSVEELVQYYYEEAELEGIRPDVALCQAIKETGTFGYGGDVLPEQNNFCGLGATGNKVKGAFFDTPRQGVRAHIQHLLAYASERIPATPIIDPRYTHILENRPEIHGNLQRWIDLNGVWAVPGTYYGQDILKLWNEAKAPDDSDISLRAADKMIEDAPDDAESHIYRGSVHYAKKDYLNASLDFQHAVDLSPAYPAIAKYDLALALAANSEYDDTYDAYTSLLNDDSDFWQGWFNRGLILMKKGKYKEAIRDFESTLTRNPQMADAQNEIGVALFKLKKYNEAWTAFYKAHEINNRNQLPIKNLTEMSKAIKKK